MGKGGSEFAAWDWHGGRPLVNTGVPWPTVEEAEARVLRIQTKLHQWATVDQGRRFVDLFNLVTDPAFLVVGWARVRGNQGKRSAGVDGIRPDMVFSAEEWFRPARRADLRARRLTPMPARGRLVPKAGRRKRPPPATRRTRS